MNKFFLLAFSLAGSLLLLSVVVDANSDPVVCQGQCSEDILGITCDEFLDQYNLQGSCCSLTDIAEFVGCNVQVGSGNCSWYPKCEQCPPRTEDRWQAIKCGVEYRVDTGFLCPTTSKYPTNWNDSPVGPWNSYTCPPAATASPTYTNITDTFGFVECPGQCSIPLKGITCDDFLYEYMLFGSCCSLSMTAVGCSVQVGSGSCSWHQKCEPCPQQTEGRWQDIKCGVEYRGAEGSVCPASEYPTNWFDVYANPGPWNDYTCPPSAASPFPTYAPIPFEESGTSSFMIIIVIICVLFVMGIGGFFYCAFQRSSDYDPQQASQTRRVESRTTVPAYHQGPNTNNSTPPPPDPHRPAKIAVNLYYGTVATAGNMGMKQMSSSRFTAEATAFEPRQPNPEDECPICCDNFSPGQDYVISKVCNHVYHKRCIEQWTITEQKDDCPVCRRSLLPPASNSPPPIYPPSYTHDDVEA